MPHPQCQRAMASHRQHWSGMRMQHQQLRATALPCSLLHPLAARWLSTRACRTSRPTSGADTSTLSWCVPLLLWKFGGCRLTKLLFLWVCGRRHVKCAAPTAFCSRDGSCPKHQPALSHLTCPSTAQVGGGPTGVELAAELHDLVKEDIARLQPQLRVRGLSGAGM